MRNILLAVGLLVAGLSTRLGVQEAGGPAAQPGAAKGGAKPASGSAGSSRLASDPRNGTKPQTGTLPEDHPIEALYQYLQPTHGPEAPGRLNADLDLRLGGKGEFRWEGWIESADDLTPGACEAVRPLMAAFPNAAPRVSYMVVTLPDPVRTHQSQEFDRTIESLIAAAMSRGYNFDRAWLPWRRGGEPGGGPDFEPDKDRAARLKRPGLLLFRPDLDPGEEGTARGTLAIFLVGEQPTAGIDRYQFHNAICYIDQLSAGSKAQAESIQALRILGPSYSGSFDSLLKGLDEFAPLMRRSGERPEIVSASATSEAAITEAREKLAKKGWTNALEVIQQGDSIVSGWALGQLRARNVAILSEGDTVYGRSSPWQDAPGEKADRGAEGQRSWSPDIINYPRDISYLRNALQEMETSSEAAENKMARSGMKQLPLSFREFQGSGDAVPVFGTAQLPVVQESVLLRVADRLKRRGIDTAILTGTNVLDLLFLSKFLREACPDVRLLVLDWNLLFTHGLDTRDYAGIAVASTFPPFLHLETHEELPGVGMPPPHIFLSQQSRGVYEAARRLLGDKEGKPREAWLSVIGRDDSWPVANMGGGPLPELPRIPRASVIVHVAIQFGFFLFVCLRVAPLMRETGRVLDDKGALAEASQPGASPRGATYLMLMLTAALAAAGLLAAGPLVACWDSYHLSDGRFWLVALPPAAAGLSLCLALAACVRIDRRCLACVPFGQLILVASVLAFWWPGGNEFFLRAYRSAHASSSVGAGWAPAILLLAFGWWCYEHAERLVISRERGQNCPAFREGFDVEFNDTFAHFSGPVPGWSSNDARRPRWRWGAANQGGVLLVVLLLSFSLVRTFETPLFDWYVRLLLALVTALLAGSTYEFWAGWRHLARLLEVLHLHPVRQDVKALQQVSLWNLMWQGSARKRSLVLLQRSSDCIGKLMEARRPEQISRGLDSLAHYRRVVDDVVYFAAKGHHLNRLDRHWLLCLEKQVDELVIGWLRGQVWKLDGPQEGPPPAEDASGFHTARRLAGEYAALRITAFIRYILLHLRTHFSVLTVVFILLSLASLAYPFQGESLFRGLLLTAFLTESAVVGYVFYRMDTDATLSELTNTKEGKLEAGFFLRLAGAGALPLLAVLSSLFPALRGFLLGWVQPALAALH